MTITIENEIERLSAINWLSNYGNNNSVSFKEAIDFVLSDSWENFQLERRNELTSFLSKNMQEKFQSWNEITVELRINLEESVYPVLEVALREFQVSNEVLPVIKWDILSYMQAKYFESKGMPEYYISLIIVYEDGNLPYGWAGKYPEGQCLSC